VVVANDVEDRGPTLFPTLDRRLEVTGNLPAAFPQQGWPADDDPSAVDCGHYAPTSHRSRIGDVSWCDVPLTGGRDDGAGQRVFAFRFDPGCQGQQLLVRDAARGSDPGDCVLALGQGAGLVEQNGVHRTHAL